MDISCLRTPHSLHWLQKNESNVILFLVTVCQRGGVGGICLATPHFHVKGRRGCPELGHHLLCSSLWASHPPKGRSAPRLRPGTM